MKLKDIFGLFESKKNQPGTYSGLRASKEIFEPFSKYCAANNIENPVDVNDLHCTVLYSPKHLPDYVPLGMLEKPYKCTSGKFEIWPSHKEGKFVLVYLLDCDSIRNRHEYLMHEHDAEYTHAEYKPHMTFSYDIDEDFDVDSLPDIDFDVVFDEEYYEPINEDW